MTQYQSKIGSPGAFNTPEWFSAFLPHVTFKDKIVADYGCAEGVMTELAAKNGASVSVGIEKDSEIIGKLVPDRERMLFIDGSIEETNHVYSHISILSMIIHWIDEKTLRKILDRTYEKALITYSPQDYERQRKAANLWFPAPWELDRIMESCGFQQQILSDGFDGPIGSLPIYNPTYYPMGADEWRPIDLVAYDRYKLIELEGKQLTKRNKRFDWEWAERLHKIQQVAEWSHLLEFGVGYCKLRVIEGFDLSGNKTFTPIYEAKEKPLPKKAKKALGKLLDSLGGIFVETGLMFIDLSKRDIIYNPNTGECYLVGMESIGLWNPDNEQWKALRQLVKGE